MYANLLLLTMCYICTKNQTSDTSQYVSNVTKSDDKFSDILSLHKYAQNMMIGGCFIIGCLLGIWSILLSKNILGILPVSTALALISGFFVVQFETWSDSKDTSNRYVRYIGRGLISGIFAVSLCGVVIGLATSIKAHA